jgi:EF hand
MRLTACLLVIGLAALFALSGHSQGPAGKGKGKKGPPSDNPELIDYMMSFNKKKDGKLTKEELTDTRLHRLFDRADADKDGAVTRAELEAVIAADAKEFGSGPGKGFGKDGKGKDKGPPKKGPPPE